MIHWSSEYELGIPKVDQQHQVLVALINRLERLHEAENTSPTDISEVLKHLIEYTRVHFGAEEELMQRLEYADFEAHRAKHEKFVELVDGFRARYGEGETNLAGPILHFLTDWLLNHIARSDREYVRYFQRKGTLEEARLG